MSAAAGSAGAERRVGPAVVSRNGRLNRVDAMNRPSRSIAVFLRRWWPAIAAHAAALALWQLGAAFGGVPKFILPTLSDTLATLAQPHYRWLHHIAVTTLEVFGGYALAVAVGVLLALLITWSRALAAYLMPLIVTLNMIPKIALAPLFVVWLSYGIVPNIIIAFTICFFPILITTARGLSEVDPDLLDLAHSVRASRLQIFAKIQFPGALPYVFSGMKVAAIFAVAGAIVGEFVGSERGLGFVMLNVQATLDTAGMFMAVLLISIIGGVLYLIVLGLERLLIVRDARIR